MAQKHSDNNNDKSGRTPRESGPREPLGKHQRPSGRGERITRDYKLRKTYGKILNDIAASDWF